MSSHHIIREKQEPALIIANGEACSGELLGQLLEWSPFIVVLDSAIHRVLDLGIKVDAGSSIVNSRSGIRCYLYEPKRCDFLDATTGRNQDRIGLADKQGSSKSSLQVVRRQYWSIRDGKIA